MSDDPYGEADEAGEQTVALRSPTTPGSSAAGLPLPPSSASASASASSSPFPPPAASAPPLAATSPLAIPPLVAAAPAVAAAAAATELRLEHYRVLTREDGRLWELGRGAMGVTYKALDTRLHFHVALKMVNAELLARYPTVRERFLREARAAARLRHPNIASVFHLGETAAGQSFFAMEFIEGETLDARVRRAGPLPVALALELGMEVARALIAAAQQGLIHRDLKPANLMLVAGAEAAATRLPAGSDPGSGGGSGSRGEAAGGGALVKVIDFGLAKAAGDAGPLTVAGDFLGTPAFASPEQFADTEADPDGRSDIYSLGVTLWFALTGRLPFPGRSAPEVRARQLAGPLPAGHLEAARVPAAVGALLSSMLAAEPTERPQTPYELLEALRRCRDQLPAAAPTALPPSSPVPRSPRRPGPARPLALAAALVLAVLLLLLAGAGAWGLWGAAARQGAGAGVSPPAPPPPAPPAPALAEVPEKSIAVLPFDNLSADKDNAFFTDGVQDEILTDLAKVADLKVISRSSVMAYRSGNGNGNGGGGGAPRNLRQIAAELGVAHILEGSVQRAGNKVRVSAQLINARSDAHVWAERYDRPLDDVFAIQSEIAQAIADQLQARLSPLEKAAMTQAPTNDVLAFQLYHQAKELDSHAADPGAKDSLLQAVGLLGQAIGRDPKFLLAHCLLARVHLDLYWDDFDHSDARREQARAAIEGAVRLQPDAGDTHVALAVYYYHGFHDYERALAELTLARRTLPNNVDVLATLGAIHRRQGLWNETIHEFEQAADLDPRNFSTLQETAFTHELLRRYPEAARFFNRALAVVPGDGFTRESLAMTSFYQSGDLGPLHALHTAIRASEPGALEGSAYFRHAAALVERDAAAAKTALEGFPARGYQDTTNFFMPREWFVGLTARVFGDASGARAAFAAARVKVEQSLREQPDYPEALAGLARIDAGLGRKEDALREARRACELLPVTKDAFDGPEVAANLALVYAWTGEKTLALEQLERVARLKATPCFGGVSYGGLKRDPQWDPLRGDPRFESIVVSLAPKTDAR